MPKSSTKTEAGCATDQQALDGRAPSLPTSGGMDERQDGALQATSCGTKRRKRVTWFDGGSM